MSDHRSPSGLSIRGLHLDFKGLPPTIDHLLQLLPLAATAGYNALLCEWEDMFPWSVDPRFRAPYAYGHHDIQRIHDTAHSLGMQVIPLVQCLGHMQTPLSQPEYRGLAQKPYLASTLNPLAPGAKELVGRMIDDVLAHSPKPTYFHLGGDEAWGFGSGDAEKQFITHHGGPAALYMHHVEPLLDHLLKRGIRPILWHDMMTDWPPDSLRRIAAKADLMVWGYSDPPGSPPHQRLQMMQRFAASGVKLWGACAYKGADGPSADLPNFAARTANAQAFAQTAKQCALVGVIATAWSRYSTHRVQCEPIDGALDAMVAVGQILAAGTSAADLRARSLQLLAHAGHRARFDAVHNPLQQLQDSRHAAWDILRQLREQLALSRHDELRRRSGLASEYLCKSIRHTHHARIAATQLLSTLQGLIPDAALQEYARERLDPLEDQNAELMTVVTDQEPQAWAALKVALAVEGIQVG